MRLCNIHENVGDSTLMSGSIQNGSDQDASREAGDQLSDQYDELMQKEKEQREETLKQPLNDLASTMTDIDKDVDVLDAAFKSTAKITPQIAQARSLITNISKFV